VATTNINISEVEDYSHNRILKEIDELKENDVEQMQILHTIQAHF
jgi:hypothetical protein